MSVKRICYGCVPPDRHPGCNGTCEKYRTEWEQAQKKYSDNLKNKKIHELRRDGLRNKQGLNRKMYIGEVRK